MALTTEMRQHGDLDKRNSRGKMQSEIKELMKSSVCIPHFEKFDCEREKIIEAVNGGILKDTVKYVCMPVRAIQESGYW